MTTQTILKFILEVFAVLLISYGFYREENVVKLEQKIFKKCKRLFKRIKQIIKNIIKLLEDKKQ